MNARGNLIRWDSSPKLFPSASVRVDFHDFYAGNLSKLDLTRTLFILSSTYGSSRVHELGLACLSAFRKLAVSETTRMGEWPWTGVLPEKCHASACADRVQCVRACNCAACMHVPAVVAGAAGDCGPCMGRKPRACCFLNIQGSVYLGLPRRPTACHVIAAPTGA